MRCQQADRRLNEYQWDHALINADSDLRDHLKNCSACTENLRVATELQSAFSALRTQQSDPAALESATPFAFMRTRIDARTAESGALKDQSLMSRLLKQLHTDTKAGKLGLSAAVAVLALGFFTLVPFSYEETVGYEVAFAGVDKNLALNEPELQKILIKLGMPNTAIDVTDCEATCKVKFSELPTSDDARLLVTVFSEFETIELEAFERVTVDLKGSFVQKAGSERFFGTLTNEKSDSELHEVMLECLGEDFSETCNIYIDKISGLEVPEGSQFVFDTEEGALSGIGNLRMIELKESGTASCDPSVDCSVNGHSMIQCMTMADCDSLAAIDSACCAQFCTVEFSDGQLTDEELQRLRDSGFDVTVTANDDGTKMIVLKKEGEDGPDSDNLSFADEESNESLDKELSATLPEGYELSQNYPNPFNPNTKIDFTVPSAEHVTVDIINLMGQTVRTLVDETVGGGSHTVEWDATNEYGQKVSSGMYFYRLKVGTAAQSKKMTLLK